MPARIISLLLAISLVALIISSNADAAAAQENPAARQMMVKQLEALKTGDYQKFVENGNKAFKELADTVFRVLEVSWSEELAKGYHLDYLGAIHRVGMTQYLWKVIISGSKSEHLGTLTLADGKIAAFDLD